MSFSLILKITSSSFFIFTQPSLSIGPNSGRMTPGSSLFEMMVQVDTSIILKIPQKQMRVIILLISTHTKHSYLRLSYHKLNELNELCSQKVQMLSLYWLTSMTIGQMEISTE